jgi:predicted regulator of Ras-like GTPase activity (Roadblock/LC7/MglB family)
MSDPYRTSVERLSRVSGVRGALIVDLEAGIPVSAELAEDVSGSAVAALAAALYRRTSSAAQGAGFGPARTLQLESADGHVVMVGAGELVVVVVAEPAAQLGLVRLEANRAAEEALA